MTFEFSENQEVMRDQLCDLAQDLAFTITVQGDDNSQELLGIFVSELFKSATQLSIHMERSEKQRKAVADAMARGVRFGKKRKPLPVNFDEVRMAWRNHEMNLQDAAKLCGMPTTTFYDAVRRAEQATSET